MSNITFKSLLNSDKYILFDYGNVDQLPTLQNNYISGICKYKSIFYIKHIDSNTWQQAVSKYILYDIMYGQEGDSYGFYSDLKKTKSTDNNIMIWTHDIWQFNFDLSFFIKQPIFSDSSNSSTSSSSFDNVYFASAQLPYVFIDNYSVAIDFTGFKDKKITIVAKQ